MATFAYVHLKQVRWCTWRWLLGELLRNLSLGPMESWKVFLSSVLFLQFLIYRTMYCLLGMGMELSRCGRSVVTYPPSSPCLLNFPIARELRWDQHQQWLRHESGGGTFCWSLRRSLPTASCWLLATRTARSTSSVWRRAAWCARSTVCAESPVERRSLHAHPLSLFLRLEAALRGLRRHDDLPLRLPDGRLPLDRNVLQPHGVGDGRRCVGRREVSGVLVGLGTACDVARRTRKWSSRRWTATMCRRRWASTTALCGESLSMTTGQELCRGETTGQSRFM